MNALINQTPKPRTNHLIALALTAACLWPSSTFRAQSPDATPPVRLEPVNVVAKPLSLHDVNSEADLVGPAQQPEWTARRAFGETDIYVIPSGEIEFNQFYISSHPRHGKPENLFESEFEFGLPWRTQFDVELNYNVNSGRGRYDSTLLELPHALADWGKIPFNPTIDGGWRFRTEEADSYFARLLLAEEFGKRVHFGMNLAFERQVSGELETGYELTAGLSYVAIDQKLTIGMELLVEYETSRDFEGGAVEHEYSTSVALGPLLLYKPTRNTQLALESQFGLTQDAPSVGVFLIFGIDFEPFAGRDSGSGESGTDKGGFWPLRKHH
jgi:hypothetical protein